MPKHFETVLIAGLLLAGCSANGERDRQAAAAAVSECEGLNNSMAIGMNAHDTCLVEHANKTHPANKEICDMANSEIDANSGVCLFGQ